MCCVLGCNLAGLLMTLTWVVHYYAIWWQITLNLDCTGARHWTVADRQAIRKTAATHWVVLQGDDGDDGVDGGDEDDDMIVEMMEFMAADHGITIAGATHCVASPSAPKSKWRSSGPLAGNVLADVVSKGSAHGRMDSHEFRLLSGLGPCCVSTRHKGTEQEDLPHIFGLYPCTTHHTQDVSRSITPHWNERTPNEGCLFLSFSRKSTPAGFH